MLAALTIVSRIFISQVILHSRFLHSATVKKN
jgi:hypothetical protein